MRSSLCLSSQIYPILDQRFQAIKPSAGRASEGGGTLELPQPQPHSRASTLHLHLVNSDSLSTVNAVQLRNSFVLNAPELIHNSLDYQFSYFKFSYNKCRIISPYFHSTHYPDLPLLQRKTDITTHCLLPCAFNSLNLSFRMVLMIQRLNSQ